MRPVHVFLVSVSMVYAPAAALCDDNRVAANTQMPFVDSGSLNPANTAPSEAKPARGFFFGYVEFDVDPDAPGGVPGFSPLPAPVETVARAAID